jgi:hypothetical protein
MVIVFPYGTCAICDGGLPRPRKPSQPRTICDAPACISEHRRFAARRGNAPRSRRKREATTRACPQCARDLPLSPDHWYVDRRNEDGSIAALSIWCKVCKRWYQMVGRWVRQELAEQGRLTRAMARHAVLRRMIDEEPDLLARAMARRAATLNAYRSRHPEMVAAQGRRQRERVKADPVRLRRRRESRRIASRLRRERQGQPLNQRSCHEAERDEQQAGIRVPMVPAKPLADVLERRMAAMLHEAWAGGDAAVSRETLAESWGTTDRSLRAWRDGERQTMHFNVADALLVAMDLLPWDVWDDPDVLALWPCGE